MCYSVLVKRDVDYLKKQFGIEVDLGWYPEGYSDTDAKSTRIFPGSTGDILVAQDRSFELRPMIYGAFPPASVPKNSTYTTYNARRDNLGSRFWSESYLQHHGLIVIEAFYEWVGVADLIRGGEVSLEDVEKTFEKQSLERKKKVLESNKKYRPTPTELKDPRERKIIIQFAPQDKQLMHVPVIFSVNHENAKEFGFAIITDDPPQDVSSAGHDRCPIVLSREGALDWFTAKMKKSSDYLKILGDIRVPKLIHKIA